MKRYLAMLTIAAMMVMGGCSSNSTTETPAPVKEEGATTNEGSSKEELEQFEQQMIDKAAAEVEQYFGKKIDISKMDFAVAEEVEENSFERIKDMKLVDDIAVVGNIKGQPNDGDVIELVMKYDMKKEEVDLLKIKPMTNESQQVSSYDEEKMKEIAEKFIQEKKLVQDPTAITFEEIKDQVDYIELDYDDKHEDTAQENDRIDGITIGLDKVTLEPIMFER